MHLHLKLLHQLLEVKMKIILPFLPVSPPSIFVKLLETNKIRLLNYKRFLCSNDLNVGHKAEEIITRWQIAGGNF